jgi:hypothetical protein
VKFRSLRGCEAVISNLYKKERERGTTSGERRGKEMGLLFLSVDWEIPCPERQEHNRRINWKTVPTG